MLCGGASRRLGTDKALVVVRGRPLAVGVADAVGRAGADPVAAIGGDAAALGGLGLAVVADRWPGAGPAGAVATALAWARRCGAGVVLVAACDHPDVNAGDLAALVAAVEAGAAVAVASAGGRTHPTVSAWRVDPAAVAAAAAFVDGGGRRLGDLADALAPPGGCPQPVAVAAATCADIDDADDLRRYADGY